MGLREERVVAQVHRAAGATQGDGGAGAQPDASGDPAGEPLLDEHGLAGGARGAEAPGAVGRRVGGGREGPAEAKKPVADGEDVAGPERDREAAQPEEGAARRALVADVRPARRGRRRWRGAAPGRGRTGRSRRPALRPTATSSAAEPGIPPPRARRRARPATGTGRPGRPAAGRTWPGRARARSTRREGNRAVPGAGRGSRRADGLGGADRRRVRTSTGTSTRTASKSMARQLVRRAEDRIPAPARSGRHPPSGAGRRPRAARRRRRR